MRPLKLRFVAEMPTSPASSNPVPSPMHGPHPGRQRMRPGIEKRSARCRASRLLPAPSGWPRRDRTARRSATFLPRKTLAAASRSSSPRIHAGDEIRFLDRDLLLGNLGDRLHHLHRVRSGDVRRDLGEIEHDTPGIDRIRIGRRRIVAPLRKLLFRNARDALRVAVRDCARPDTSA